MSIVSYSNTNEGVFVAMKKNGDVLSTAYAIGTTAQPFDQGSVTIVAQLAVGDEVWVENLYGGERSIWGDSDDSFMGCLVITN